MQVKALGEYMRKLVDSNVMSFRKSVVIPLLDEMASGPTHTWKHPRGLAGKHQCCAWQSRTLVPVN